MNIIEFFSNRLGRYTEVSEENPFPVIFSKEGLPVTGVGGGGGSTGPDGNIAVGRETQTITATGETTLGVDYTFIDVKVSSESTVILNLPKAAAFGFGRLLYVKDKSGVLPAGEDVYSNRIEVVAAAGEGIDGHGRYHRMNQQDDYVVLKATASNSQAWQIVGTASHRNISNGFYNFILNNADYTTVTDLTLQGPHAYIPVGFEIYKTYAGQKWWLRFYATEADRTADASRAYGSYVAPGLNEPVEIIVGGDAPAKSFNVSGGPKITTTWDAAGKARNGVFMSARQLAGPLPGRLTGTVMYYELNAIK